MTPWQWFNQGFFNGLGRGLSWRLLRGIFGR